MEEKDIREICTAINMHCNKIQKAISSFDKELFFIDDKYLIRTSKQPMLEEQIRINRIKDLKNVPRFVHASDLCSSNDKIYYLILQYIQGIELYSNYQDLQDHDKQELAEKIACFLLELHSLKGEKYDIGHYVPIIPGYDKSWRSGHERYWRDIYMGLKEIQLSDELLKLLEMSNDYIDANISCLDYENGPSLLHNDFHYKNIIIHNNKFSGVIDWECSQYGEADFDLIHVLHWSLFPPSNIDDMTPLLKAIFRSYWKQNSIPMLEKRLTIYLIEHDFIKILWSKGKQAEEFLPRINWWLCNLEDYIQKLL